MARRCRDRSSAVASEQRRGRRPMRRQDESAARRSYDAFNLPTPPGTYNVYYSYWSSPQPYWARRRKADGTMTYEMLRSTGGTWSFANCTNQICTDAQRRTQLQNSNGASGWGWWIEAWNTASTSNC